MEYELCTIERDVEGAKAALCPKCGEIKALGLFEYYISRLDAKQQGYAGTMRVKKESTLCNVCRPKRRPLARKTKREVHNMVVSGDMSLLKATALVKKRKESAAAAQTRGVIMRWERARASVWTPLLEGIRAELHAIHQQRKHNKKAQNNANHYESESTQNNANHYESTQNFVDTYKKTLIALREVLKVRQRKALNKETEEKRSNNGGWENEMSLNDTRRVADAWGAIDSRLRLRMRTPALLKERKWGE